MRLRSADMPKLHSPFVREMVDGKYVCTPVIDEEYRWVFEDSVAIEKLDGTNISIDVEFGQVKKMSNRDQYVDFWKKGHGRFTLGLIQAINKSYFNPQELKDGRYFGELIGPDINGNPYGLEHHVWLPFTKVQKSYRYKFWQVELDEMKGGEDSFIYDHIQRMFKGLWSLKKRQVFGPGEKVTKNTAFEGAAAEGIVFYNNDGTKMSKLTRSMFDWYKGSR